MKYEYDSDLQNDGISRSHFCKMYSTFFSFSVVSNFSSLLGSILVMPWEKKADGVFLRASAQSHFADFGSTSFNCDLTIYLTFSGLIFKSRKKKWRIATEWLQKRLSAD